MIAVTKSLFGLSFILFLFKLSSSPRFAKKMNGQLLQKLRKKKERGIKYQNSVNLKDQTNRNEMYQKRKSS